MPQPVDLYVWRNAIASVNGPQNAQARLTLLVLALHMNADGSGAWPSQASLAKRSAQCRRTIVQHLADAEREGWIVRSRAGTGKQNRLTSYEATVPDDLYGTLPERPWEADPEWRRGASAAPARPTVSAIHAPANSHAGATNDRKLVQLTTFAGATGVSAGAFDSNRNIQGSNQGSIHKTEGALACTAVSETLEKEAFKGGKPKTPDPSAARVDTLRRITVAVEKFADKSDHEIAAMVRGATPEDVHRVRTA